MQLAYIADFILKNCFFDDIICSRTTYPNSWRILMSFLDVQHRTVEKFSEWDEVHLSKDLGVALCVLLAFDILERNTVEPLQATDVSNFTGNMCSVFSLN